MNHYIVTGTSFSFSELFLLPLMFLLRKEILYGTRQISSGGYFLLMFGLILWALLIAIGMVYDIYGSLRGVLGARAYLYILLLAVFFRYNPLPPLQYIGHFALGAVAGDLAIMLETRYSGAFGALIDLHKSNLVAIFLLISIAIIRRNLLLIIASSGLITATTLLGAFRINILVAFIALGPALCFYGIRGRLSEKTTVLFGVSIATAVSFWLGRKYYRRGKPLELCSFRIFDRTVAFLRGDMYSSQDLGRAELFISLFSRLEEYLLPKGFLTKNRGGWMNDLPLMELLHVFSLTGASLLLLFFAYFSIRKLRQVFFRKRECGEQEFLAPGFILLTIAFILLNGRFLYVPMESIPFGMCLGMLVSIKRLFALWATSEH